MVSFEGDQSSRNGDHDDDNRSPIEIFARGYGKGGRRGRDEGWVLKGINLRDGKVEYILLLARDISVSTKDR